MSIIRDFQRAAAKSAAPVTVALIVLIVAGFLAIWFRLALGFFDALVFDAAGFTARPWSALTFPFVSAEILSVLFACLWLWGAGGTVEREDGSLRYIIIWLVASALSAIGLWIGSLITGNNAVLLTPWVPVAALTVIWGTRHPETPVNFMFVLCIQAKWVAWISALLVFFSARPPQMAPFAALPLIAAYLYAVKKLPIPQVGRKKTTYVRGAGAYREDYFDAVRQKQKDREERERLRKLFESSLDDKDSK